ncbi:MAG: HAD family hydrolase, partial [bacterium]
LAVDKTGTITQGLPKVVGITEVASHSKGEILRRAAAINCHSEHPLATAIVTEAQIRKVAYVPATDYVSITGQGAQASVDGHPHFIGNHRMAHEAGVCTPDVEVLLASIEAQGHSLAILGHFPHGDCKGEIL